MPRRPSPYSHFLTLYKRGYLRDHISRIMHAEGYKVTKNQIRQWFKDAPKSARAERKLALKIVRARGVSQKDRMWGYLYRYQAQIDPETARAAWAWLGMRYGEMGPWWPEMGEE